MGLGFLSPVRGHNTAMSTAENNQSTRASARLQPWLHFRISWKALERSWRVLTPGCIPDELNQNILVWSKELVFFLAPQMFLINTQHCHLIYRLLGRGEGMKSKNPMPSQFYFLFTELFTDIHVFREFITIYLISGKDKLSTQIIDK